MKIFISGFLNAPNLEQIDYLNALKDVFYVTPEDLFSKASTPAAGERYVLLYQPPWELFNSADEPKIDDVAAIWQSYHSRVLSAQEIGESQLLIVNSEKTPLHAVLEHCGRKVIAAAFSPKIQRKTIQYLFSGAAPDLWAIYLGLENLSWISDRKPAIHETTFTPDLIDVIRLNETIKKYGDFIVRDLSEDLAANTSTIAPVTFTDNYETAFKTESDLLLAHLFQLQEKLEQIHINKQNFIQNCSSHDDAVTSFPFYPNLPISQDEVDVLVAHLMQSLEKVEEYQTFHAAIIITLNRSEKILDRARELFMQTFTSAPIPTPQT